MSKLKVSAIHDPDNDNEALTIDTAGNVGVSQSLSLADTKKAQFGTSNELQIYHDASGDSWITENAAGGSLNVQGDNLILGSANGDKYLFGVTNSYTKLYYDNSEKLATTSTGVDITGALTVNGSAVGGANTPAFTAYLSSVDSGTESQSRVIPFDSTEYNVGSDFNTSTYRFVASEAGYYYFALHARVQAWDQNYTNYAHIQINLNGGTKAMGEYDPNGQTYYENMACSCIIYMNGSSDYVDCRYYADSSNGSSQRINNGAQTRFTGFKLIS